MRGKRARGFTEHKVTPEENQLIGRPQLLILRVPQVLPGWELVWAPPGTFSPNCLESLTPGTYTSEGSLFSSMVLCRQDMQPWTLRCLRAIMLEMLLLSAVTSPPLFTWVPLGNFLRLFEWI